MSTDHTASPADLQHAFERGVEWGWRKAAECFTSHADGATKQDVRELKDLIRMKNDQLAAALSAVNDQVNKVAAEQSKRFDDLTAKITALEEQLANADVPQNVTDALDAVKASLQQLDDTIPDAPPTP